MGKAEQNNHWNKLWRTWQQNKGRWAYSGREKNKIKDPHSFLDSRSVKWFQTEKIKGKRRGWQVLLFSGNKISHWTPTCSAARFLHGLFCSSQSFLGNLNSSNRLVCWNINSSYWDKVRTNWTYVFGGGNTEKWEVVKCCHWHWEEVGGWGDEFLRELPSLCTLAYIRRSHSKAKTGTDKRAMKTKGVHLAPALRWKAKKDKPLRKL